MSAPLSGQVAVSATPTALSATPINAAAYSIKAPVGNVAPVYIGPAGVATSTGYNLDPGDKFEYERRSQAGENQYNVTLDQIFVVGTTGDKITWFASP